MAALLPIPAPVSEGFCCSASFCCSNLGITSSWAVDVPAGVMHITVFGIYFKSVWASSQVELMVKNPPTNAGDMRHGFSPRVRKIPCSRAPCGSAGKESGCNAGDLGSIPGSGRSPGEGNGNPLQYSCLEKSMDRGTWWATVHWITHKESDTTEGLSSSSGTQKAFRVKYGNGTPLQYSCLENPMDRVLRAGALGC